MRSDGFGEDAVRVLLVANESLRSPRVVGEVATRAGREEPAALLVAPTPGAGGLLGGGGPARKRARRRVRHTVDALSGLGVRARGTLGDPDPLRALLGAARRFSPDQIVLSTYPAHLSEWRLDGLLDAARERAGAPVHHLVVPPGDDNGAGAAGPRMIRLYHYADREQARRIEAEERGDPIQGHAGGVWMIAGTAGRRSEGRVAFAMDVPLGEVRRFEREPGFHDERRFFIPAESLSRLGRLVRVDERR